MELCDMVAECKKAVELTVLTREDKAHMACWPLLLLLTILLAAVSPGSMAASPAEDLDATVDYLITYVKESDVLFERNFSRYSGREAAQHINKKYLHFKDEIDTPEKFIELCATGSLITGKPYYIITGQGEPLLSSEWLNAELSVYRLRNGHGNS
jgi:hypothetical protein